jgi:hypothetical protein
VRMTRVMGQTRSAMSGFKVWGWIDSMVGVYGNASRKIDRYYLISFIGLNFLRTDDVTVCPIHTYGPPAVYPALPLPPNRDQTLLVFL